LNEIPKDLIDLESTRNRRYELDEIKKIDKWLEENPKSKKVNKVRKPRWVSVVALFNTVFHHYSPEEAFSNRLDLPFIM